MKGFLVSNSAGCITGQKSSGRSRYRIFGMTVQTTLKFSYLTLISRLTRFSEPSKLRHPQDGTLIAQFHNTLIALLGDERTTIIETPFTIVDEHLICDFEPATE